MEYNIPFEKEKIFDSCVYPDSGYHPRFDFYIDNCYLIEFDGKQHFDQNNPWFREGKDDFKTQWAQENQIPLIRIKYDRLNDLSIQDLLLKEGE